MSRVLDVRFYRKLWQVDRVNLHNKVVSAGNVALSLQFQADVANECAKAY